MASIAYGTETMQRHTYPSGQSVRRRTPGRLYVRGSDAENAPLLPLPDLGPESVSTHYRVNGETRHYDCFGEARTAAKRKANREGRAVRLYAFAGFAESEKPPRSITVNPDPMPEGENR